MTFGVGAMLMPLPSDGPLLAPLMRTLRDQNLSIVGTPRFGIANGQVVLSLLQPVEAMADDNSSTLSPNSRADPDGGGAGCRRPPHPLRRVRAGRGR